MSEFKGTKGPWTWVHNSASSNDVYCIEIISDGELAYLQSCEDYGPNKAQTLANANLIAAAPDLLEALIAVVRVADRATDEFDMARAAIAKALGETK